MAYAVITSITAVTDKNNILLAARRLAKRSPLGKQLKLSKGEQGFMWKHTLHTKT